MNYSIPKLGVILLLFLLFGVSSTSAQLYATDSSYNYVAVYNKADDGNVSAQQTIIGPDTGIQGPMGIAADADSLYVVQFSSSPQSVTVYEQNADGNVAPLRTISGAATLLNNPFGLAVDRNFIYVANQGGCTLTVYNLRDTGEVVPVRTLSGDQTRLGVPNEGGPAGVAVDANYIYVVRPATNALLVYTITADGNVAPVRVVSGDLTGMHFPYGIAVDETSLYVANHNSSITVYNLTDNGNVAPIRTISGDLTGLAKSQGIAVDSDFIYVANGWGANIPVFNLTDNGNVVPVRSITSISSPSGVAVYSPKAFQAGQWNLFLPAIIKGQQK